MCAVCDPVYSIYTQLVYACMPHVTACIPICRIHGITVGRYQDEIHQWIQDHLKHYNIQVDAKDLLNVVDRHVGKGYAEYTQEDLSKEFYTWKLDLCICMGVRGGVV